MKATYGFDGDNWKFKALEDYIAYKELYEFVGNKVAVQAHIDSYQIISLGSDLPREYPEQLLRMGKVSTLQHAVVHLASQTVVSLCATFEVAVREFLRAFFITYPASLFDFIGPNDAKGHVSLSEIIDSESRNELIVKLATRASGVASKGKYNQVFSRVSALCGAPSKSELAVHISQAQSDRNKIVHERCRAPRASLKMSSAPTKP